MTSPNNGISTALDWASLKSVSAEERRIRIKQRFEDPNFRLYEEIEIAKVCNTQAVEYMHPVREEEHWKLVNGESRILAELKVGPEKTLFEKGVDKYGTREAFGMVNPYAYERILEVATEGSSQRLNKELELLETNSGLCLYSALINLFSSHSESLLKLSPIKKIIAFGGGSLNPGIPYVGNLFPNNPRGRGQPQRIPQRTPQRTQHAALLAVKKMLWKYGYSEEDQKITGKENNIEILLQDYGYMDIDARVAELNGMRVLNSDYINKETQDPWWLEIDESTLIVDFGTPLPIHQLIFEIARPAAIFSHQEITKTWFSPSIISPTKIGQHEYMQIAGLGRSDYTFENFTKDYECDKMSVEGLSVEGNELSFEGMHQYGKDGYNGKSYLGL